MTKKKKESSIKDKIIIGLLWIVMIISLFFILAGIFQFFLALIEGDSIQVISTIIMILIFYGIYNLSTKSVEKRTENKLKYKPLLYLGGIFLGFILLGVIIGFYEGLTGPSEEEIYQKNLISSQNREIPETDENNLYSDSSEILLTENSSYTDKFKSLSSFAYGEDLNCSYPQEQVGEICCIRSSELVHMCEDEYQILLTEYENTNDVTIKNQNYKLNDVSFDLPEGYYLLEDIYMGGDKLDLYLIANDAIGNYYEIKVDDLGKNNNFNHRELSYFLYNTIYDFFNSTISEINFYKNENNKISYFDYYLEDDVGDISYIRYAIVEKNENFYAVIYSGSNEEYINEVNLITDSLN
jgi:hypothetical protein